MSRRSPVYPDCYGHLYSESSEQCQCCLLRDSCSAVIQTAVAAPSSNVPAEIPKDKKALVIAVCHKFGIPTKYFSKKEERWIEVEGNESEFINLDFLLTSKEALVKLLKS